MEPNKTTAKKAWVFAIVCLPGSGMSVKSFKSRSSAYVLTYENIIK